MCWPRNGIRSSRATREAKGRLTSFSVCSPSKTGGFAIHLGDDRGAVQGEVGDGRALEQVRQLRSRAAHRIPFGAQQGVVLGLQLLAVDGQGWSSKPSRRASSWRAPTSLFFSRATVPRLAAWDASGGLVRSGPGAGVGRSSLRSFTLRLVDGQENEPARFAGRRPGAWRRRRGWRPSLAMPSMTTGDGFRHRGPSPAGESAAPRRSSRCRGTREGISLPRASDATTPSLCVNARLASHDP